MAKKIIIPFVLLLVYFNCYAQLDTTILASDKKLIKHYFTPKKIVLYSAVLGTSFLLDKTIKKTFNTNQSKFLDKYFDITDNFGEKYYMIPSLFTTYGLGYVFKNKRLEQTSLKSIKSVFVTAFFTEGIKIISGRARPYKNLGNHDFELFKGQENDRKSFPSGHVSLAWALFTPFAQEYSKWIYILPASVTLSRMYKNKHWFSDVVLGGGLGYISGLFFSKRLSKHVIYTGKGFIIKF